MTSKHSNFKSTPIPHRSKLGYPMKYVVLSEEGIETKVARDVCLAHMESSNKPYPQRWYVDEESGLVIRLPRTSKSEELARDNMRYIWREAKQAERQAGRIVKSTTNDEGDEALYEIPDTSREADIVSIVEDKALLDALYSALADLTQEDADLVKEIFWNEKTERQLAPELGLKEPKSVNKRKHRVLEILRSNEALRSLFE